MSVTTYLMGGCANQMFQFATGLAVARWLRTDLKLDVSRFNNANEFRKYSLGLFKGVTEIQVTELTGRVIREQGMPYHPELFACTIGECSIFGYWQTEKYFSNLRDELVERFVPLKPLPMFSQDMLQKIEAEGDKSVFLTIRRTDYVGNSFHGLLPYEYYLKASAMIAEKVHDPMFFIFSDDPLWCEQHFQLPCRSIVAGNYDLTVPGHLGREDAEIFLMTKCKHAILANSSYSWWGRWLSSFEKDGMTIAPKNWFGPTCSEDPRDIVPERWTRI